VEWSSEWEVHFLNEISRGAESFRSREPQTRGSHEGSAIRSRRLLSSLRIFSTAGQKDERKEGELTNGTARTGGKRRRRRRGGVKREWQEPQRHELSGDEVRVRGEEQRNIHYLMCRRRVSLHTPFVLSRLLPRYPGLTAVLPPRSTPPALFSDYLPTPSLNLVPSHLRARLDCSSTYFALFFANFLYLGRTFPDPSLLFSSSLALSLSLSLSLSRFIPPILGLLIYGLALFSLTK
jgi:hypothetical protein